MQTLRLPGLNGGLEDYRMTGTPLPLLRPTRPFNRVALAAAHIVVNPASVADPSGAPDIDWERTLAFFNQNLRA